jgi:hypothetical protein
MSYTTHVDDLTGEYTEYQTMKGVVLRIYTPPLSLITAIAPKRPKPSIPSVAMETKAGKQKRVAKDGDIEFADYQQRLAEWEEEQDVLQEAAKIVTALRDVDYPSEISINMLPHHVQDLYTLGLLQWPSEPYVQRAVWLRATLLEAQNDEYEVDFIVQKRSGVPAEVVDAIKNRFRNSILRKVDRDVDVDDNKNGAGQDDEGVVDLEAS